MGTKKDILLRRLSRLEDSLHKEQSRLHNVINNIGWGTGMRCTKCTPSFRREDEISDKIRIVKTELKQLEQEIESNEMEMNQTNITLLERIGNAIRKNKFSFENVMRKGVYYGKICNVLPLFCSYGCIGYVVDTEEGKLTWDFELNKLNIERVA